MELIINKPIQVISNEEIVVPESQGDFIEANTQKVTLNHLKDDTIIPVFSKDNESTISHFQFIDTVQEVVNSIFSSQQILRPNIRVSHEVKGRVPTAIGKPAKELLDHEKTIYYERCAFMIEIPSIKRSINGNELSLIIGGVRAYNQENLYSRKSLEKFKVFVGFKNKVCTNLCISTDGFSNDIRILSLDDLSFKVMELIENYNQENHLNCLEQMYLHQISELQFAHLIGKARMYNHLQKNEQKSIDSICLNDGQLSRIVKDYYNCKNFGRASDGAINLWRLYNLLTEANKSSYIDSNIDRSVGAYEFIQKLTNSMKNQSPNWYLPN